MTSTNTTTTKLWGGRFDGTTDPIMHAFNASIHFDKRMWAADITGSQAYAKALARTGLISQQECDLLVSGLAQVGQEWANGSFAIDPVADEDIHTANERRLSEIIGKDVAGKLHTGRSRNDQVATDMRLWLRDAVSEIKTLVVQVVQVLAERAEAEIDVIMPGYTHLQRAQPIRWSHFLLSYASSFLADIERLAALYVQVNQLPLGSGALAGNPFNIDREFLCTELGFDRLLYNSLHGVSDRDFVAEFLFVGSLIMTHISRLAEDLITYSSAEFGFVTLADAYSTGSSLMPQKKNPDSLELLRGKVGRVFGGMAGFLMTYKGLPSTYNKDLQEDKEPMFDSYDTLHGSLHILARVIGTLTIHDSKMRAALTSDMLATDLADYLVKKGVPFRATHHVAGAAVKLAETRGCQLSELSVADFKSLHKDFGEDVVEKVFDFEACVDRRSSIGGTAKARVLEQVQRVKDVIAKQVK
ncbi:argininosuccinate lyase [Catenaria anguillulae PL171]|uniref:Argininosuccinate lyase n=1 Tax=Catenaria anguillulae PL171 TaxID=765915 RepID=A0A1Y2HG64_9FUNG|nr:argininosuccinate lyase [Catenaria anguillulae PL171]